MKFALIDYGASNMFSLLSALKRLDIDSEIIAEEKNFEKYSAIILPGVGNFCSASKTMTQLRHRILYAIEKGTPLFGICLGLQLMFEYSEEGEGEGLGFFKGSVVRFPNGLKVPHMGWNLVRPFKQSKLLTDIQEKMWVYFAHSYYPKPLDDSIRKGTTNYGIDFPSVIEKDNIFGTQFHPEKSGSIGYSILKNFINNIKR